MLGTLAVPVLQPRLLQVDVAGGGVVGEGLQNRPVAPQIHQPCRPETAEGGGGSQKQLQHHAEIAMFYQKVENKSANENKTLKKTLLAPRSQD